MPRYYKPPASQYATFPRRSRWFPSLAGERVQSLSTPGVRLPYDIESDAPETYSDDFQESYYPSYSGSRANAFRYGAPTPGAPEPLSPQMYPVVSGFDLGSAGTVAVVVGAAALGAYLFWFRKSSTARHRSKMRLRRRRN